MRILSNGYNLDSERMITLTETTQNMASTEAETLNLMQKLSKIRKIADVVKKSKKGFNYNYSDISDILAKVKAGMDKYGVSLIPKITPNTTQTMQVTSVNTKVDKQGKAYDVTATEFLTTADMVFTWVDDSSGEAIDVPWAIMGSQADPSQAFGSGLTYCTRYFMTNYFQIPQVDADVDAYRSKQREAAAAEDTAIAKGIIAQLDVEVRKYNADHPEEYNQIGALIKRFVKSGNYNTITNPELAAKLLNDFRAQFSEKKSKKDNKGE